MFLSREMIAPVLASWIEAELVPQTEDAEKLFAVMAALAIAKRGEALAEQFSGPLSILGLCDGAGRIDIDAARDLAREALTKTGKVRALGFVFGPDDVDSLAALAEKNATA